MAHVLAIVILPPLADFLRAPAVDGPRKLWEDRDDMSSSAVMHTFLLIKQMGSGLFVGKHTAHVYIKS